jgi:hypothetical protein
MPIICSGVNRASQEKLVPITTRQNSDSIVPDKTVITLELAVVSPENGANLLKNTKSLMQRG